MEQLHGIATVWVITWRFIWPVVVMIGFLAVASALPLMRQQLPSPRLFWSMLIVPLLGIVWAGAFRAAEQSLPHDVNHWYSSVHNAMAFVAMFTAVGISVYFRRTRRSWLLFLYALFVIVFTLSAWFVGTMAISDTWV